MATWCPAEIILFTAGVEDYAVPIAERLQQRYSCFDGRLYRPATQGCPLVRLSALRRSRRRPGPACHRGGALP